MNRLMIVIASASLAIASGTASAGFTCEQIKEKAVRKACIEDRSEKENSDAAKVKAELDRAETEKKIAESKNRELDEFIKKAQIILTKDFKDPESAKFTDIVVVDGYFRSLCGYVNGKNSYGAYVGRKRFYISWQKSGEGEPDAWVESERGQGGVGSTIYTLRCEPAEFNVIQKIDH